MTTAAESAAPAKIVRILNFMIFPQMVWRFRVLSGAHYHQAGCADSQNPLMHPWAKPLPVYPDQRTSADWPGMSEKCQFRKSPVRSDRAILWLGPVSWTADCGHISDGKQRNQQKRN